MKFFKGFFKDNEKLKQNVESCDGYYKAGASWYEECYESITVSRNRWRMITLLLGFLLAILLIALSSLLPLKQYVYRLVEVNKNTGEVVSLKELENNKYKDSWVITRYFLNQYIMNRHLYSFEDIKRTFNQALALSSKSIAKDYMDLILDTNPESPLNILNTKYYRAVKVHSINQLNENTALVRFSTVTQNKNVKQDRRHENMQAVIKWKYQENSSSLKERDINPLGFLVTYYQESPLYVEGK